MDFEVKSQSEVAQSQEIQFKNGVMYQMPQSLSTTSNATFVKNYSQRQAYNPGQTIVFDLNTGSSYIDPENSCLLLDIQCENADTPFTSSAGAIALLNEVRVFAKNGVELDRIQDCNQYMHTKLKYEGSTDFISKYSTLWGQGDDADVPTGTTATFCIPMKFVSSVFNPVVKGMKIPASLLSGARIEIVLESSARALGNTGTTSQEYLVSNPVILMKHHELNDQTQKILNEESANNGLEYTYTRVFSTREANVSTTSLNIQVKKAVSQSLRAFTVPVLTASVANGDADSLSTDGAKVYSQYQYRIGSQFYPQQKVVSQKEGYFVSLDAMGDRNRNSYQTSGNVSYAEYDNSTGTGAFNVMAAGFETNQLLNLSGVPINNSNTLELQATVDGGGNTDYFTFMEYVCVARAFLTNVSVKL